jgi:hypothetical protein
MRKLSAATDSISQLEFLLRHWFSALHLIILSAAAPSPECPRSLGLQAWEDVNG